MKVKSLVIILIVLSNLFVGIIVYINISLKNYTPSRYQKAYSNTYVSKLNGYVTYSESSKGSVFFKLDHNENEYLLCDHYNKINSKDIPMGSRVDKDSCSFFINVEKKDYNIEIRNELYPTPNCKISNINN